MTGPHRTAEYDTGFMWFFCPGCDTHHRIKLGVWTYNGDPVRPTFNPSVNVSGSYGDPSRDYRCHSFVKDGRITYLTDSTHHLAGHTVDLPMLDDDSSPKRVA